MKIKIMFIDDDETFLIFASKACKKIEKIENVIYAKDGREAIDFLIQNEEKKLLPNIIFVDINMPKMNGFEFLEEFNKLKLIKPNLLSIKPIAMLTSSNEKRDLEKAKTLGAELYFIKQTTLSEFRNSILGCIDVTNV